MNGAGWCAPGVALVVSVSLAHGTVFGSIRYAIKDV